MANRNFIQMWLIICGLLLFGIPTFAFGGESDIILPNIAKEFNLDLMKAIETRVGSRRFDEKTIPIEHISSILWAGYGVVSKQDNQTANGHDGISGATLKSRLSIPAAWGKHYLRIYLLIKNGSYQYVPNDHKLILVTDKNIMPDCGANASDPFGVIVIAVDFSEMPGQKSNAMLNVAFMSAGAAAQNMCLSGTAFEIQMLLQTIFKKDLIIKELHLQEAVLPLAILPFGYPKKLQ